MEKLGETVKAAYEVIVWGHEPKEKPKPRHREQFEKRKTEREPMRNLVAESPCARKSPATLAAPPVQAGDAVAAPSLTPFQNPLPTLRACNMVYGGMQVRWHGVMLSATFGRTPW